MFEDAIFTENIPIDLSVCKERHIELVIKREDKIHPLVSGNKYRKLKYNIRQAIQDGHEKILTFGGAYSNHIAASAFAAKSAGLQSVGVIRGEELAKDMALTLQQNATLRNAVDHGMELDFISRESYRNKNKEEFLASLKKKYGDVYIIPEGGTNPLAIKGCEEILMEEDQKFDYICSAVGTGGTMAGIVKASNRKQKVIGFPALKGDFLIQEMEVLTEGKNNWSLQQDYHFGGYGKFTQELITFLNTFKEQTGILLDPIYTGKMMFGIVDMIANGIFSKHSKILAIHTGGLQGIDGVNKKLKNKNWSLINIDFK